MGIGREAIKNAILDFGGKILVFDDLERATIPLSDIMGLIDSYLGRGSVRVIILANESEITKERMPEYTKMKEKIVAKTLVVASEPAEVLSGILADLKSPFIQEFIQSHSESIHATIIGSGIPNFRTLRAVVYDFERLLGIVDEVLVSVPSALHNVLLCMLAIGLEIRSGRRSLLDVAKIMPGHIARLMHSTSEKQKPEEIEILEHFEELYPHIDWRNTVIDPHKIGRFLTAGVIDVDEVNRDLRVNY
ncbi:MAG: hypothetical protein J0653_05715, partial [Deltaproteobacteria bacterium]|nr:hypothetical protein [Deltaproteobacteria bacterium]